jgi:tetratricopeptide (TPR) repeat protein/predicted Ser/Thr protein kinase
MFTTETLADASQSWSELVGAGATVEVDRSAVGTPPDLGDGSDRPDRPPEWQTGDVLNGRYRVLASLGHGGMGRVYRVSDGLHPERDLALKSLASSFLVAARVDLFKAEFRTMSELTHPHIARVYDFETLAAGDAHAFTMEFIEGRDLLAATEGVGPRQLLEWVVEACRALHYLHSRGVVHADFKPQNVMVTTAGRVKVLDFGLSGAHRSGMVLGTPAYMAPELRSGLPADARVDLYALGITLYQLLFRRVPFVGHSMASVLHQHERSPLVFPYTLEAGVERLLPIVEKLCAKRPEQRFTTANAVITALAEATGTPFALETAETKGSYVSSARLVGREPELQQVLSFCLSGLEGRAGDDLVMAELSGVSGVGKSRLMREVRKRLQLSAVPFVEASCYEGGANELGPLKTFSEALRTLTRARGLETPARDHQPTLEWLRVGEVGGARRRVNEEERERISRLRDLADFTLDVAEAVGFVLYINDLQWARTSTTDFLRILCERRTARTDAGSRVRLALVVSYRDDEVTGRPLQRLLEGIGLERRATVRLSPLGVEQTRELIGSMLGTTDVPQSFGERVRAETGGNPFFIEEILRALMERGDVYLQAGSWAARTQVADLELPTNVAAVLERRLAALEPLERDLLEWLAVYAQPMSVAVLGEVSGLGASPAAQVVQKLVDRQMVEVAHREGEEPRARPGHDKLRQYVYDRQEREARTARHLQLARALDRLAGPADDFTFERAHHYWHGLDKQNAAVFCTRAAEAAERSFATDVALENYDRLRQLASERGHESARRDATEKVLELCTVAGQYDRIVSLTTSEMERRTDRLDLARLYQVKGEALDGQGKLDEAIDCLHRAVALLGMPVPRSRAGRKAFIAWHYLRHRLTLLSRAGDFVRPAVLSDRERRRREVLARCFADLSVCAMMNGDDVGFGVNFAGINVALPLGNNEALSRLLVNVTLGHHAMGRFRESERMAREAARMADSDIRRAHLLTVELLARQLAQHPVRPDPRPVNAHEPEILAAIDTLSLRSKALYANLARMVGTLMLSMYSRTYQYRPEVFRWAEAMPGTLHYTFVEGGAAIMALIAGERERAERAYARSFEGRAIPVHRGFVDANYAHACAVIGNTEQAIACLRSVDRTLAPVTPLASTSLWVSSIAVAASVALLGRGSDDPVVHSTLRKQVGVLDRLGDRLPAGMRLIHEAGRMILARSTLANLERAKRDTLAAWEAEQAAMGPTFSCVAATLSLKLSPKTDCAAASSAWAREALQLTVGRFPSYYVERVRELLALPPDLETQPKHAP